MHAKTVYGSSHVYPRTAEFIDAPRPDPSDRVETERQSCTQFPVERPVDEVPGGVDGRRVRRPGSGCGSGRRELRAHPGLGVVSIPDRAGGRCCRRCRVPEGARQALAREHGRWRAFTRRGRNSARTQARPARCGPSSSRPQFLLEPVELLGKLPLIRHHRPARPGPRLPGHGDVSAHALIATEVVNVNCGEVHRVVVHRRAPAAGGKGRVADLESRWDAAGRALLVNWLLHERSRNPLMERGTPCSWSSVGRQPRCRGRTSRPADST